MFQDVGADWETRAVTEGVEERCCGLKREQNR